MGLASSCRVDRDARRGGSRRLVQIRLVGCRLRSKSVVRILIVLLIDIRVSMSWIRDAVGMGGHLWDGQRMGLRSDVLSWAVERGRDGGGTLTHHTHYTSCWVRKIKRGAGSAKLVANDLKKKIVGGGGEGTTVAEHPADVIVADKRHFHVSCHRFVLSRKGGGTTKNRGHVGGVLPGGDF